MLCWAKGNRKVTTLSNKSIHQSNGKGAGTVICEKRTKSYHSRTTTGNTSFYGPLRILQLPYLLLVGHPLPHFTDSPSLTRPNSCRRRTTQTLTRHPTLYTSDVPPPSPLPHFRVFLTHPEVVLKPPTTYLHPHTPRRPREVRYVESLHVPCVCVPLAPPVGWWVDTTPHRAWHVRRRLVTGVGVHSKTSGPVRRT